MFSIIEFLLLRCYFYSFNSFTVVKAIFNNTQRLAIQMRYHLSLIYIILRYL